MNESTVTDLSAALSNSLSASSILILTALGLSITFGVMKVINMAHGDLMMLGAYTALVVTGEKYLHLNIFWAIPASFLFVGFVGLLIEMGLIRFLYGRPLDTLLATWGVGMIIQQIIFLCFNANMQPMHQPEILQGNISFGDVSIPIYRLFVVGIMLFCLLGVYVWFYWTSFGLKIRAVVQNRPMAAAMGISTRRVDAVAFAFASGLAGVAGCILAHLFSVKYNMGADYIVKAFMVVILGGMGNLTGTIVAGLVIGFGNQVISKLLLSESMADRLPQFIRSEVMAEFLVFVLVIGFLLMRPSGLFPTKERSYD